MGSQLSLGVRHRGCNFLLLLCLMRHNLADTSLEPAYPYLNKESSLRYFLFPTFSERKLTHLSVIIGELLKFTET